MRLKCSICGWVYDEEEGFPGGGIDPGTSWQDVPDDFRCPMCGAMKKWFQPFEE
ncbi:MAG: rubredoxin [Candidatus Proteinoplasmatales archaeon SG8-5]|nr:MAG: rubredoxin [Candidatus Proteinoplasmatales archaeon SG8-5]